MVFTTYLINFCRKGYLTTGPFFFLISLRFFPLFSFIFDLSIHLTISVEKGARINGLDDLGFKLEVDKFLYTCSLFGSLVKYTFSSERWFFDLGISMWVTFPLNLYLVVITVSVCPSYDTIMLPSLTSLRGYPFPYKPRWFSTFSFSSLTEISEVCLYRDGCWT